MYIQYSIYKYIVYCLYANAASVHLIMKTSDYLLKLEEPHTYTSKNH